MMNIKSIFMSSRVVEMPGISGIPGISLLFGIHSIYNVLEYLRILNINRAKQINNVQELLHKTRTKCIELQENYDNLNVNFQQVNKEINVLKLKIFELQNAKVDGFNLIDGFNIIPNTTNTINTTNNTDNIPNINVEIIKPNFKDTNNDNLLSSDYIFI